MRASHGRGGQLVQPGCSCMRTAECPLARKRVISQSASQRSSCTANMVSAVKGGLCLHCYRRAGAGASPPGAATHVARHPWRRVACQLRQMSAQGTPLHELKGLRARKRRRHGDPPGFAYGERCVFVSNDWHAALVPSYLAAKYRRNGVYTVCRRQTRPQICVLRSAASLLAGWLERHRQRKGAAAARRARCGAPMPRARVGGAVHLRDPQPEPPGRGARGHLPQPGPPRRLARPAAPRRRPAGRDPACGRRPGPALPPGALC